jgi:UDP-N-acetylmuramate dehydrogenase
MSDGSAWAAQLRSAGFEGRLVVDQPLAPFTTWRIGGAADLLAQPAHLGDMRIALAWCGHAKVPWRVMGNGSNLRVGDGGVRGLVLRVRKVLDGVERQGCRLNIGAGASFPAVSRHAARLGLAGIEFGAGIPGTLGGALVMNAGWHEFEIGNSVRSVTVLDAAGERTTYNGAQCCFGYRSSIFRERSEIVVACELELRDGDVQEIEERLEGFAASRKANQPTELPSCGSVFLKPSGDFAGRLIEQAGLKGLRVGDLQVSPKHANFFVNLGQGTAAQAIELVETVEEKVRSVFGVRLTREFELW